MSLYSDVQNLRAENRLTEAALLLRQGLRTLPPEDVIAYVDACASVFAWDLITHLCDALPPRYRTYPLWVRYHYTQSRSRAENAFVTWPLDSLPDVDTSDPELRLISEAAQLNLAAASCQWPAAATHASTILDLLDAYPDRAFPFFLHIRPHTWLQIIPLTARYAANPTTQALAREILSTGLVEPGVRKTAQLYSLLFPVEALDSSLMSAIEQAEPFLWLLPEFVRDRLPALLTLSADQADAIHDVDEALPGLALPKLFGLEASHPHSPALLSAVGATFTFTSLSGASRITGNSHLVRLGTTNLLLDLGLDVNIPPAQAYQAWKNNLLAALPDGEQELNRLFAILVSHAHTDHVGLLPMLYRDPDLSMVRTSAGTRPKIRIMANDPTREIASVMLRDMSRMHEDGATPAFSEADVTGILAAMDDYPVDSQLDMFRDRGRVETWHAGHILGSQMLLLEHEDVRVMFTGDINTLCQAAIDPVVCPPGPIDVLIMEHTYGSDAGRLLPSRAEQEAMFLEGVDCVLRRGGSVVVPAFAVGRSQEILCLLAEYAQQNSDLYFEIALDGLARSITESYDYYLRETTERYQAARNWLDRRLRIVGDKMERDAVISEMQARPGVVVASSGMLKAGSASHQYAQALGSEPRNAIFLTGYLAEDSEAGMIASGKRDALDRMGMDIRCEARHFHFTAHAPRRGLLDVVYQLEPRSIILVHGDAERSAADPSSLYNVLRRDGFDVHLGREKVPYTFRGGRLVAG